MKIVEDIGEEFEKFYKELWSLLKARFTQIMYLLDSTWELWKKKRALAQEKEDLEIERIKYKKWREEQDKIEGIIRDKGEGGIEFKPSEDAEFEAMMAAEEAERIRKAEEEKQNKLEKELKSLRKEIVWLKLKQVKNNIGKLFSDWAKFFSNSAQKIYDDIKGGIAALFSKDTDIRVWKDAAGSMLRIGKTTGIQPNDEIWGQYLAIRESARNIILSNGALIDKILVTAGSLLSKLQKNIHKLSQETQDTTDSLREERLEMQYEREKQDLESTLMETEDKYESAKAQFESSFGIPYEASAEVDAPNP